MMISTFYTITIIAILGALSPGPDFVVVAKNALGHNRRCGIMSALGITLGIVFHASYCILGLAIIISKSLLLFSTIRYVGAGYLIYLGIKSLLAKRSTLNNINHTSISLSNIVAFKQGFVVNVLNPKCILFILSIFTVVIKPNTALHIQALFGLDIALITGGWFVILSFILTHHKVEKRMQRIQHVVNKIMGAALIMLGLELFFTK